MSVQPAADRTASGRPPRGCTDGARRPGAAGRRPTAPARRRDAPPPTAGRVSATLGSPSGSAARPPTRPVPDLPDPSRPVPGKLTSVPSARSPGRARPVPTLVSTHRRTLVEGATVTARWSVSPGGWCRAVAPRVAHHAEERCPAWVAHRGVRCPAGCRIAQRRVRCPRRIAGQARVRCRWRVGCALLRTPLSSVVGPGSATAGAQGLLVLGRSCSVR